MNKLDEVAATICDELGIFSLNKLMNKSLLVVVQSSLGGLCS